MPPDYFTEPLPESQTASVNFNDTELTLRLPGEPRPPKLGRSNTIDLNLRRGGAELESESSSTRAPPSAKADVAGWPPVRSYRKKALGSRRYVKVAIDGAPYLRKVDLEAYGNYQELLRALEEMSTCFFNHVYSDGESKPEDLRKDTEYLPTYEDKDGDWMLVGDVPWKMFKDSCQRIRVMRSSGSPQIDS